MSRTRVAAATTLSIALLWALLMLVTGNHEPPMLSLITAAPDTTTTQPDFAALVQTDAVGGELAVEEEVLTEEANATTTTTTISVLVPTTTRPESGEPANSGGTVTTSPPTTSLPATIEPGYVPGAESDFASKINSYRSSNGKSSLSRDGSLNSYARSWAKTLAERGSLGHSNIGSLLPPWSGVGENVGSGGSVISIFDALAASSGHRANMLGDYTHFGVGVYRDSSGRLWTAHVFAR